MLGTLKGALEVRGVPLEAGSLSATAHGTNELVDGVLRLTGIEVVYSLRVPAAARETAQRALERHQSRCPMARSLEGAVKVSWRADVESPDA